MAAKPSNITSVTIELPFLNSRPPSAGSRANAKGVESQTDESRDSALVALNFGRSRSSVEDWKVFRASKEYSEKFEDLRLALGLGASVDVDVETRFIAGRCRN